ncbi:ferritin-like domain-containing protein [Hymenobacter sp. B81]|uniref:ferritin-like domain-containing protein n=1 Tax=Hymenobacter sp. B81 TaxID=3344878 RepID=UPI0037DDCAAB
MSRHLPAPETGSSDLGPTLQQPMRRRSFLLYSSAAVAATGLLLAGCDDDDNNVDAPGTVDLGSGDIGILNYAYALEQLEAAFYTEVKRGAYYAGASAAEKSVLDDLAAHEIIHREFLKAAISANGGTPIKALEVDFSAINFGNKTSVLETARTFEDLGVAAYNGAGKLFSATTLGATLLTIAGKIVSVEARHAALIRDLISNGSFVASNVVNAQGLELSKAPADVAAAANGFLKEGSKLNGANLPKE